MFWIILLIPIFIFVAIVGAVAFLILIATDNDGPPKSAPAPKQPKSGAKKTKKKPENLDHLGMGM